MDSPPPAAPVRTTCPYCGVGCGILARREGARAASIAGDPAHPANAGRLCGKGLALGETLGLSGRLLHPMMRDGRGVLERVDWGAALDRVAGDLMRIRDRDGPDAIAFYLSGQLLTEDYYAANKLMKGFLGSANVDTNSRLCMASTVAGHRRAFGGDVVPGRYADLDLADLIVLVGSNAAWCHPVLFQRIVENRAKRGAKVVVIDPRRTATASEADLFLPVAPGNDTALFAGLLVELADTGRLDSDYIATHTNGFAEALAAARALAPDAAATAALTGLPAGDIARFFALFRSTERVVTAFSQGVNQSSQGTDKVNAIINCHLATGRIGRPGMGPFSLTGQPNAMGGREVGGLANQLAAHMDFAADNVDRVRRFWRAPRMAAREGLKAVQMFEAIERGAIKALVVMGTNPAVSLPRAGAIRAALGRLELFVVADNVLATDTTTAGAHVLLPAAAWGEKDGTVTNSERRISRQRAFLPLPGEARPDWWIVCELAGRMGFGEAFPYAAAADIFREHAALSAFENNGRRAFDIGDLAGLSGDGYDDLDPVSWPTPAGHPPSERRLFAEGGFPTPDGRARFVAPATPRAISASSSAFPLRLNTGRIRDQWHTMTRTGMSPRLALHRPEPFVEVHPADAARHGLADGGFARVATRHGAAVLKVVVTDEVRPGSLFAPIHWSAETASAARIGDLVGGETDPISGQPDAKATPAAISAVDFACRGFVLSRAALRLPPSAWWARVAVTGGTGYLLAGNEPAATWREWVGAPCPGGEMVEYADPRRGDFRAAVFAGGRLELCLFIGSAAAAPQWDAARALFREPDLDEESRRLVLSGRSAEPGAATGPLVCACFGVGLAVIRDAIIAEVATDVAAIGKVLRAGTNCGACLPELKQIIAGTVGRVGVSA